MQEYCTLTRRELSGFFLSLTGYIVIAAAAFLIGFSFIVMLIRLGNDATPMPMTELFYVTPFFWVILLLTVPVITMRLFAQEKFSGTYETLMTTPVTDVQVVAAKFTAAVLFYMVMWLPLLACILILRHFSADRGPIDFGGIGSTFLGILLLGCFFISLGCFASALTRSQVTAAIIGLVFNISVFLLSFLSDRAGENNWKSDLLSFFALPDQMHDFSRGVVDSRPIIFCLTLTFFFLFITLRMVESRRWK
jgi:ABC-2 type transport system permease protein